MGYNTRFNPGKQAQRLCANQPELQKQATSLQVPAAPLNQCPKEDNTRQQREKFKAGTLSTNKQVTALGQIMTATGRTGKQ